MGMKPEREKLDRIRRRDSAGSEPESSQRRAPLRTAPRGNGDMERRDVERALEKLDALVGR